MYHLNHFQVHSSVALNILALLGNHHHHPVPELAYLAKLEVPKYTKALEIHRVAHAGAPYKLLETLIETGRLSEKHRPRSPSRATEWFGLQVPFMELILVSLSPLSGKVTLQVTYILAGVSVCPGHL